MNVCLNKCRKGEVKKECIRVKKEGGKGRLWKSKQQLITFEEIKKKKTKKEMMTGRE